MVYDGELIGKMVRLRSVAESDAEFTYNIRQDKEKTAYLHSVSGTVEDQAGWIRRQREREGDYFFLAERLGGEPLGTNSIYDIANGECENGRTLLYGTPMENSEVYMLSLDFAFDILGLSVVKACAHVNNNSAIGVFVHFGAEETGHFFNDDIQADYVSMRLTRENYKKSRPGILAMIERFAGRATGRKGG